MRGCGFSATFNGVEQSLFFSVIKQSSWDESKKLGSFSGPSTAVKLTTTEAGAFLDVITRNVEFSAYHLSKDAKTQIWFKPYIVEMDGVKTQKGFGLSITQDKNGEKISWLMPFSWADARVLENYIQYFLRVCFSIEESEHKKKFKEKQEKVAKAKVVAPNKAEPVSAPPVEAENI